MRRFWLSAFSRTQPSTSRLLQSGQGKILGFKVRKQRFHEIDQSLWPFLVRNTGTTAKLGEVSKKIKFLRIFDSASTPDNTSRSILAKPGRRGASISSWTFMNPNGIVKELEVWPPSLSVGALKIALRMSRRYFNYSCCNEQFFF